MPPGGAGQGSSLLHDWVMRPSPAASRSWPPAPLRIRAYRWYWLATWPTLLGTWMQIVALGYLVFSLTGSTGAVAVVAAADGLPAVVLSLIGGVLADRFPRRRILLVTQTLLAASSATLALLVVTGHAGLASIAAIAVVYGATDSVDLPTRQAFIADLVSRDLVVSAVALGSVVMSVTRIVGPSLGGLLIATTGPGACFAVLAAAYLAPVAVLLLVIPDVPPLPRREGATAITDLIAGLRVVRHDPMVRGIVIACSALALLGVSYMPYLPVLARTQLHAGPQVLGLLYSVGGLGGLVAGLALATYGRGSGRRGLLAVGGAVYAVSLFTVSHGHTLWLTIPGLVGISFAFLAMNTSMTTLLQTDTDPALRGRMMGIYATIFAGLQPLGTLLYGAVAGAVGLFDAIGIGAIAVGVTAMVVATRPSFRGRLSA